MKNKLATIIIIFFFNNAFAENIFITAKNISLDKVNNTSVFENEVVVKTKNKTLKSEFAKYNRETGFLILKENISVIDEKNNKIFANHAEYYEKEDIFKTFGKTKIETPEKYTLNGEDIIVDNINKTIKSEKNSILEDQDGNLIFLDNSGSLDTFC